MKPWLRSRTVERLSDPLGDPSMARSVSPAIADRPDPDGRPGYPPSAPDQSQCVTDERVAVRDPSRLGR
jgi:hypothetical protein